ncbi:cupin, partial [bacterium]
MPASPHLASLRQQTPQFVDANGSIAKIQAADLPVLKRLSIRRLTLAPQAVREPHWHANAHELGY